MNTFKRLVASLVIASTTLMGLPMTAQAAIVSTDEAMSTPVAAANRDRVNTFLTRSDVRKALQEQGVNGDVAVERVKAMSDTEVAQLAGRIDQAPAGGDILGILFTIFIVLLVTDIMGLTKVFPFTRSIR
jgi:glutamate mutase epsilon subunit